MKSRCPQSVSSDVAMTYENADPTLTDLLTDMARIDPDLAFMVRAWPTLSEQAKAAILAVVKIPNHNPSATECR